MTIEQPSINTYSDNSVDPLLSASESLHLSVISALGQPQYFPTSDHTLSRSALQTVSTPPPVTVSCCERLGPGAVAQTRCHDNCGAFPQEGTTHKEGRASGKMSCRRDEASVPVEPLTFLNVNFLPLHPVPLLFSHGKPAKILLWLQYFNSICYLKKTE